MIKFASFYSNIENYGSNHESVIQMMNDFLEELEDKDCFYLDHKTHFLENDMVIIELKYKEGPPTRKVIFEKIGS